MRTVLVTGASGRIGKHVVPLLLNRGYRVRVAINRTSPAHGWANEVETIQLSFPARESLAQALDAVDTVVHLAGIMPPAVDDEVFRTNIEGTCQLLQAVAPLANKPRLLFASSDATYCTGWSLSSYSEPITEETEHHPTGFYGLSKVLGERMCLYFEEMHKIPVVRLRFVWTLEPSEILDLFINAPYKDFLIAEDRGKWDGGGVIAAPLEENGRLFSNMSATFAMRPRQSCWR